MKSCKGCKHYKTYKETNLIVCEFIDSSEETKCVKDVEDFAIAELEKLRSELHETAEMHIDGDYYLRDEWIDEYIDNHIAELKGEKNA